MLRAPVCRGCWAFLPFTQGWGGQAAKASFRASPSPCGGGAETSAPDLGRWRDPPWTSLSCHEETRVTPTEMSFQWAQGAGTPVPIFILLSPGDPNKSCGWWGQGQRQPLFSSWLNEIIHSASDVRVWMKSRSVVDFSWAACLVFCSLWKFCCLCLALAKLYRFVILTKTVKPLWFLH